MPLLKYFLYPFSCLYGIIMWLRNLLYDYNILTAKNYSLPIINVGNLSFGGTGKTPMIEYLIRLFQDNYKVATLSRGYNRKTSGYILANQQAIAADIGDEPLQFFQKFKNILVAVSEKRTIGIENLLRLPNKPNLILLDDAFQHRPVKAGLNILLTTFDDPCFDDYVLPMGRLREFRSGKKRADIIIVTKCSPTITKKEKNHFIKKIKPLNHQEVYFSCIDYDEYMYNANGKIDFLSMKKPKLIVAGIANSKLFIEKVFKSQDEVLNFPDHHNFSKDDINKIEILSKNKVILTTEKDYMRLRNLIKSNNLYYLPITIKIIYNQEQFNQNLQDYVRTNSRNS